MFALSNVASVDTRESLEKHFGALDGDSLKEIACYLNLVPEKLEKPFDWHRLDESFLRNLLASNFFFFFCHTKLKVFIQNFHRFPVMNVEFLNWKL